jgi:parallel beta-helix repeat protein
MLFLGILLAVPAGLSGTDFCVSSAYQLQNALIASANNGLDDTIQIYQGTYYGTFSFSSNEGRDLTILGGFTFNCTSRVPDPNNTILDGSGSFAPVLNLRNDNGGSILIEGITVRNTSSGRGIKTYTYSYSGNAGGTRIIGSIIKDCHGLAGGGVEARSESMLGNSGTVEIRHNLIQNNLNVLTGAGVYAHSIPNGKTILANNIITGNTALQNGGGVYLQGDNILFVNNTVTDNTAPSSSGGGFFGRVEGNTFFVYNNIIRGNSGGDIWFFNVSTGIKRGFNNNYGTLGGGWTQSGGNINADPRFVSSSDLHLKDTSPCIEAGSNLAPELPARDLDGRIRVLDFDRDFTPTVDMGAYEYDGVYMPFLPVVHGHDFDNDGRTEASVFRHSNGYWYIKDHSTIQWGTAGDIPVNGDFEAIPRGTEVAVWRPSDGTWYIKNGTDQQWGIAGDVPVPGDYDGDGLTEVAVWRPSDGTWYIKGMDAVPWGEAGQIPVPGDYDGDSVTDIAVWDPADGTWSIKDGAGYVFGMDGDIPVPADYDGDGDTDIAVWRPSNGTWYIKGKKNIQWGTDGDIPVPGMYSSNSKADIAVWRPSDGVWYIKGNTAHHFGAAGDIPVIR